MLSSLLLCLQLQLLLIAAIEAEPEIATYYDCTKSNHSTILQALSLRIRKIACVIEQYLEISYEQHFATKPIVKVCTRFIQYKDSFKLDNPLEHTRLFFQYDWLEPCLFNKYPDGNTAFWLKVAASCFGIIGHVSAIVVFTKRRIMEPVFQRPVMVISYVSLFLILSNIFQTFHWFPELKWNELHVLVYRRQLYNTLEILEVVSPFHRVLALCYIVYKPSIHNKMVSWKVFAIITAVYLLWRSPVFAYHSLNQYIETSHRFGGDTDDLTAFMNRGGWVYVALISDVVSAVLIVSVPVALQIAVHFATKRIRAANPNDDAEVESLKNGAKLAMSIALPFAISYAIICLYYLRRFLERMAYTEDVYTEDRNPIHVS